MPWHQKPSRSPTCDQVTRRGCATQARSQGYIKLPVCMTAKPAMAMVYCSHQNRTSRPGNVGDVEAKIFPRASTGDVQLNQCDASALMASCNRGVGAYAPYTSTSHASQRATGS
jgi:hypothetical protein